MLDATDDATKLFIKDNGMFVQFLFLISKVSNIRNPTNCAVNLVGINVMYGLINCVIKPIAVDNPAIDLNDSTVKNEVTVPLLFPKILYSLPLALFYLLYFRHYKFQFELYKICLKFQKYPQI